MWPSVYCELTKIIIRIVLFLMCAIEIDLCNLIMNIDHRLDECLLIQ